MMFHKTLIQLLYRVLWVRSQPQGLSKNLKHPDQLTLSLVSHLNLSLNQYPIYEELISLLVSSSFTHHSGYTFK